MNWFHPLGFLWTLPVSIIGWLFVLFLWAFRQVDWFTVDPDLSFECYLKKTGWFYRKLMAKRWFGFTIGNTIIASELDVTEKFDRCMKHEHRHVWQQYIWGIFFFPAYIVESLRIFIFVKDEHSYLDNWFELDARKHAGQTVKIPRHMWPDGKNDHWIWW